MSQRKMKLFKVTLFFIALLMTFFRHVKTIENPDSFDDDGLTFLDSKGESSDPFDDDGLTFLDSKGETSDPFDDDGLTFLGPKRKIFDPFDNHDDGLTFSDRKGKNTMKSLPILSQNRHKANGKATNLHGSLRQAHPMNITVTNFTDDDINSHDTYSQPHFFFAETFGSGFGRDESLAMAIDSQKNVILTGFTAQLSKDCFLYKTNSDGEYLWSLVFGGSRDDRAFDVVVDEEDNIYVTGYFRSSPMVIGNSDFIYESTNPPQSNLTHENLISATTDQPEISLTSDYNTADIFVAKFNEYGKLQWAQSFGGKYSNDIGYGLSVVPQGIKKNNRNVEYNGLLVTGFFQAESIKIPSTQTTSGSDIIIGYVNDDEDDTGFVYDIQNGYILQLDKEDGKVKWGIGIVGGIENNAESSQFLKVVSDAYIYSRLVTYDSNYNIYAIGYFSSSLAVSLAEGTSFHESVSEVRSNTPKLYHDSETKKISTKDRRRNKSKRRVEKLNSSAEEKTTATENPPPISVPLLTTDSVSDFDIYILKISNDGKQVYWVKALKGSDDEMVGREISIDYTNNLYVIGGFSSTTLDLTYLDKYDRSGKLIYSYISDSEVDDRQSNDQYSLHLIEGSEENRMSTISNAFVTKIDLSTGLVSWSINMGGGGWDYGYGLCTSYNGEFVYFTGIYNSPTLLLNQQFGNDKSVHSPDDNIIYDLPSIETKNGDIFLGRINATTGEVDWISGYGGEGLDYGNGVKSNEGNLYVTGIYSSSKIINQENVTYISTSAGGISDMLLLGFSIRDERSSITEESENLTSPNGNVEKAFTPGIIVTIVVSALVISSLTVYILMIKQPDTLNTFLVNSRSTHTNSFSGISNAYRRVSKCQQLKTYPEER